MHTVEVCVTLSDSIIKRAESRRAAVASAQFKTRRFVSVAERVGGVPARSLPLCGLRLLQNGLFKKV